MLHQALFGNLQTIPSQFSAVPNFLGGFNLNAFNGETIASIKPGILGDIVTNADNEQVATIVQDGFLGGTDITLQSGEVIHGMPNALGGETFLDGEGFAGHTAENFNGGLDFISEQGNTILSSSPNIFGGADFVTHSSTPLNPFEMSGFDSINNITDTQDAFTNIADIHNSLDQLTNVSDTLDFIDLFNLF